MATLLKNIYDPAYIQNLAHKIKKQYAPLNEKEFCHAILSKDWNALELKERMAKISKVIYEFLPKNFDEATPLLLKTAPDFGGFHGMFFPHYIEVYGQGHFETSIKALEVLTVFSSSEFAVRPFIKNHTERMMDKMLKWSKHKNEHVRRLSSEGCRPRLPWAMALPEFKKDPSLILPILENLKCDSSEYVRRSVANNLNDISKDNPTIILNIASEWFGEHHHTDRLLKHAMRTMLKKGEPKALKIFGLGKTKNITVKPLKIQNPKIKIGGNLEFEFSISSQDNKEEIVRVEYCIYFLKKNGSHTRKVFKISEAPIKGHKIFNKKHSMKDLSTRKHHAGIHYISLQVNGIERDKVKFQIII